MIVIPSMGTAVLGSKFGQLTTAYRDRANAKYPHSSFVWLHYSADGWLLGRTDNEIPRYYASQIESRFGIKLHHRNRTGAHVSVIRGESPAKNAGHWGFNEGLKIPIKYTHEIYTNGNHWWLNVEAPHLEQIRAHYGLQSKHGWFHLTVGRI